MFRNSWTDCQVSIHDNNIYALVITLADQVKTYDSSCRLRSKLNTFNCFTCFTDWLTYFFMCQITHEDFMQLIHTFEHWWVWIREFIINDGGLSLSGVIELFYENSDGQIETILHVHSLFKVKNEFTKIRL